MNYWKAFFCTVLYMGLLGAVLRSGSRDFAWEPLPILGFAVFVGFLCFFPPPKDDPK